MKLIEVVLFGIRNGHMRKTTTMSRYGGGGGGRGEVGERI